MVPKLLQLLSLFKQLEFCNWGSRNTSQLKSYYIAWV